MSEHLFTALSLAGQGVPVLPLREGKVPFGNCTACAKNVCGGRPNMKHPGPCICLHPCHGWAAATTHASVINSAPWRALWRESVALAYDPAGAGVTVVDLDSADAVAWAVSSLPATVRVVSTRGEHWIYRGVCRSVNAVRPGVDIKSQAAYVRWLGYGTGTLADLSHTVRGLVEKEETTPRREGGGVDSSSSARWEALPQHGCIHTPAYVQTGLTRGLDKIRAHSESGAGSQTFGVARFLARQHANCPGPCGIDAIADVIVATAVSVGVPEEYASRAVHNGFATGHGSAA
ncbi:bifunctional DNA primase/polymerase [Streptomyces sp. NPDC048512]|uniref:bifunctional DNA primase/polymerase n=1 Tax=Streptomyces sp. NPDC048512 TaxID=3365563 RepID=UPI003717CC92